MAKEPDIIVDHKPTACAHCPYWYKCEGVACAAETRKVVDINVEVTVTAHNALEIGSCPLSGAYLRGDFPGNINAAVQYGDNLQALVTSLNTMGAVSVKRTHEILAGVFNIPISTGTISNIVHRCASAVTTAYGKIRNAVTSADVCHFDETGTRVVGKLAWVHDASDSEYTYLDVSRKRGFEGMQKCGVLPPRPSENSIFKHKISPFPG